MGLPACYIDDFFPLHLFLVAIICASFQVCKSCFLYSIQVRATGAMDLTLRQPVKGRKRGGAIRVGEMERDCLISHGAAYNLKDRLLDCSDSSQVGS